MKLDLSYSLQRAAYDMSGIADMKRQAGNQSPAALQRIAREFESLFIQMMMKSMRQAVPEGNLLNTQNTQFFTSLFDQQIAQQASGTGGFGLADMLLKQLMPKAPVGEAASAQTVQVQNKTVLENGAGTLAQTLFTDMTPNLPPKSLGHLLYQELKPKDAIILDKGKLSPGQKLQQAVTEDMITFVKQWLTPAKKAAVKSGVPYEVIIAQAALETGWGQKQIKTETGDQSHNYFGIKAGLLWGGKTTSVMTTEYYNNEPVKMQDTFRVYETHNEGIEDYIQLLKNDRRYRSVVLASTPEQAALALQQANYATDPNYGHKLIQVIQRIKQIRYAIAPLNLLTYKKELYKDQKFRRHCFPNKYTYPLYG